jgi:starch synthase (maltosyl-transferring)
MPDPSRARVVIRGVTPELECGRFPVKRVIGEAVDVEADIFADGHAVIACVLQFHHQEESEWSEVAMQPLGNDHWRTTFTVTKIGSYVYRLAGWIDPFTTWHGDLLKRIEANQDVTVDLRIGQALLQSAAARAPAADAARLKSTAKDLATDALDPEVIRLAASYADRSEASISRELRVTVDRERARFSTWYEMFPRSCAPEPGGHGTFSDCERILPEIAAMGFDVIYLPPIHPIGHTNRKGSNNSLTPKSGDPGSPWAIGNREGGHKATHPELGSLEEFRHLVQAAGSLGLEVALDIAYQCSPDHPYVREHPEWFRQRPDGTLQYAENPPKKYEDIYPFDFDSRDWKSLWEELKSVMEFWIDQGVRIFRVDNPHTKPFAFWDWMIGDLTKRHPDLIFLSEAFTRPNIMYRLAKLGFTQSYTYFTWRNTKAELTEYFKELVHTEAREFFRPNLWPNTPDILHEYLQQGGRPAFMSRLVLAATLSGNYGIYGPAYELCENVARSEGSEEYLHSEKYEIKHRDFARPESLRSFITTVNRIRRENPALQTTNGLKFQPIDNHHLIAYSKQDIITIVNLDWRHAQAGFIELNLDEFGIDYRKPYRVTDLLNGERHTWHGPRNYVELRPNDIPAHILKLEG